MIHLLLCLSNNLHNIKKCGIINIEIEQERSHQDIGSVGVIYIQDLPQKVGSLWYTSLTKSFGKALGCITTVHASSPHR